MLLEGIFLPVTTPFHADGRLFAQKLEVNIDRYGRTPAHGLMILSSQGECDALTDAETRTVLETAIRASAPEQVLLAGLARESVFAALELAESCAALGYDALAVRAPLAGEPQLFFEMVADRAALPVIAVNARGRELSDELLSRLAGHANVLGVLDETVTAERVVSLQQATAAISREVTVTPTFRAVTGRMLRQSTPQAALVSAESLRGGSATGTQAASTTGLKTRTRRVGFQILAATSMRMLECWQAGATGGMPSLGACAPQACCEVWQAFRDGDNALAAEKQERLRTMAEIVDGRFGLASLKYGCDFNAYFGGRPRLPRLPLTAGQRAEVELALRGMRN